MNNFQLNHAQFQGLSNKAIDWFIKSFKFKPQSPEWQICRLKRKIYMKKAIEYLKEANKCLN